MAKQVENAKGFLVLEMSAAETMKCGGGGICDSCNQPSFKGNYVAVLNRWYCPHCYNNWVGSAKYFDSDKNIELRNYNYYLNLVSR